MPEAMRVREYRSEHCGLALPVAFPNLNEMF
jgi:hypothetical protein